MKEGRWAYRMLPDRCTGSNKSSGRIPVDVRDTKVISTVHEHEIGSQLLVALWFLALKVEIVEFHLETLL